MDKSLKTIDGEPVPNEGNNELPESLSVMTVEDFMTMVPRMPPSTRPSLLDQHAERSVYRDHLAWLIVASVPNPVPFLEILPNQESAPHIIHVAVAEFWGRGPDGSGWMGPGSLHKTPSPPPDEEHRWLREYAWGAVSGYLKNRQ